MMLHSCQNCWFNGLQYGALGLSVGYCSRHKKILNVADGTTCGLHLRKDLPLSHALKVSDIHSERFSSESIIRIIDESQVESDTSSKIKDLEALRKDEVASTVIDFGDLGTKIASLAQLKTIANARSEIAMLSLSRGYINNCYKRGGSWLSGVHLYWWTKNTLSEIPEIEVSDIRTVGGTQLSRQQVLIAWSIIMLRLCLIEDIAVYAKKDNDAIKNAAGLLDAASENIQTFNLTRLTKWIKREAVPKLDKYLPYERYREISQELHKDE